MAKIAIKYNSSYIAGKGWHDEKHIYTKSATGWKDIELTNPRKHAPMSDEDLASLADTIDVSRAKYASYVTSQRDYYKLRVSETEAQLYKVQQNLESGRIL